MRPSHEEMHPSKVHQSTTKQADSGLVLGFKPVKKDENGNIIKEGPVENTPTKAKGPRTNQLGTPTFEFSFASQDAQLSEDAKKLMESVREDVAKIKMQMVAAKNNKMRNGEDTEKSQGDRKIAKPKGIAGRFSAAHMAQFKKMDSIAGHPSAFRAAPGRFQPVIKTLKRTPSKARLDEETEKTPKPSESTPVRKSMPSPAVPDSRAKRVKHVLTDDASTHRSESNEGPASAKSVDPYSRTAAHNLLRTPVKPTIARSSSVRPHRPSKIPSLAESSASKAFATPHAPQTEFNPKLKSNLPTFGNLKSILRRHQPLFSRDPTKIAAGTHLAAPDFSSNMLLGASRERTSVPDPVETPSPKKRVEFTLDTESHEEPSQPSPSPSKIPTVQTRTMMSDVVYPTLPALTPEKESASATPVTGKDKVPTIRPVRPSGVAVNAPPLERLLAVPHGIQNRKRRREETEDDTDIENIPPTDSTPNIHLTKKIRMTSASPEKVTTPSPVKRRSTAVGRTPGRATPSHTPSHTPVRFGTPASAGPKSKPVLSMSRLNMLAKPKERR